MCKKVIKMGKHGPTDEWIKETNDKWFAHKAAAEKALEDGPAPALVLATVSASATAPATAPATATATAPATVSAWTWLWKTSKIEK